MIASAEVLGSPTGSFSSHVGGRFLPLAGLSEFEG